ncbi:LLM class flavin-dependent oxidoreductase [Georgenia subflava]|uniref:LLM class flavin-dependent oxidoreductase n=1 Tax=Georgenia subflava TaxID=1622177 RepID=A0A6N7EK61_9MICO|nr:LLM class flavin-dependent oxidoreductase [Georgenia subflava]MPV38539.1 LLM class flavin-dependent oxidoreductase [Georgenia subflava]
MELGIYTFGDLDDRPTAEPTSPGRRINEILERVRLAEDVGLDYAGIGEHHRPDYAISAPATVIAAALAQTERIHVGSAVTVLSTEDPVRVFQQFATMDQYSGGRVELLAGRGSFIESFPLYGASLEDYDELYEEKLDLLLTLDSGNPVTWSGKHRPPLRDAQILPRPTDKPDLGEHLRIGVATGGSPASSVRAGKLGLPINYAVIGGEPRRFAPLAELYRRAHAEAGHPAATRRVEVSVHGFLAETDAEALEFFYPYQLDAGTKIARERGFALPNRISYEMQSGRHGAYVIGSPETVAEKIVLLHTSLGHDRQNFQMDVSGVPQRESLRAIELLGRVKELVDAELAPETTGHA